MIGIYRLLTIAIVIAILLEHINSWCLKTTLADFGQINYIDWSRDGTKIVTASTNGTNSRVAIYNARSLDQLHVYTGFGAVVNVVKFSRNSNFLAIGGAQAVIHLMRLTDYTIVNNSISTSGQNPVSGIDFNNGHTNMITCGNNNFLNLYSISGSNIAYVRSSSDLAQKAIGCLCSRTGSEAAFGGDKGNGFHIKWNGGDNFVPGSNPTSLAAIVSNSFRRGVDWN